jgi:hypothetical protein
MANPANDHNELDEVVFDVTKPPEGVTFVGLLDKPGEPGRQLTGLFDWDCSKCRSRNRDVAMIEPEQAFLSRWLCRRCGVPTVVRFQARPSVEWVAEHTRAVTGAALCHLIEGEPVPVSPPLRRRGGQRIFAWIAIPALVAIVAVGLSDLRSVSGPSTASALSSRTSRNSAILSRLSGQWIRGRGSDLLCFIHMDEVAQRGTYVYFPGGRRPGLCVRFDIVDEDVEEKQVIIRPRSEPSQGATARPTVTSEATIHIPEHGKSLTWIEIHNGVPRLEVYNRVEDANGDLSLLDSDSSKN